MKTLLEEKKMVVKWMGWEHIVVPGSDENDYIFEKKTKYSTTQTYYRDWNPQSNSCPYSVWKEIWDNMDEDTKRKYLNELCYLSGSNAMNTWFLHTTKPAICWKVLLKIIEEL